MLNSYSIASIMPPVEAHEAQPLGVEVELDFAYWAITVLSDDESVIFWNSGLSGS